MFDACPVHPKGTMVIPMLWRISEYVVCMMRVKNKNHHTHPYGWMQKMVASTHRPPYTPTSSVRRMSEYAGVVGFGK